MSGSVWARSISASTRATTGTLEPSQEILCPTNAGFDVGEIAGLGLGAGPTPTSAGALRATAASAAGIPPATAGSGRWQLLGDTLIGKREKARERRRRHGLKDLPRRGLSIVEEPPVPLHDHLERNRLARALRHVILDDLGDADVALAHPRPL